MSPFSSVRALMDHYYLFGFLPLLKPLAMIPLAPRLITWSLVHRFDTLTLVPDIKCSVLIAHAENDWDIPYSHSQVLFDAFLSPKLPHSPHFPENPLLHVDWQLYTEQSSLPSKKRDQFVSTTRVTGYATLEQAHIQGRNVALLLTESGGHDIGRVEGVQETIGRMFGFY